MTPPGTSRGLLLLLLLLLLLVVVVVVQQGLLQGQIPLLQRLSLHSQFLLAQEQLVRLPQTVQVNLQQAKQQQH